MARRKASPVTVRTVRPQVGTGLLCPTCRLPLGKQRGNRDSLTGKLHHRGCVRRSGGLTIGLQPDRSLPPIGPRLYMQVARSGNPMPDNAFETWGDWLPETYGDPGDVAARQDIDFYTTGLGHLIDGTAVRFTDDDKDRLAAQAIRIHLLARQADRGAGPPGDRLPGPKVRARWQD